MAKPKANPMPDPDSELRALLKSWGVREPVVNKFIDEEVSLESLRYLTDSTLLGLIPKKGPRDALCFHFNQWKGKQAADEVGEDLDSGLSEPDESGLPAKRSKRDNCKGILDEVLAKPIVNFLKESSSVPTLTILAYYEKNGELDHYTRDLLGQHAIYRALQGNLERSIPRSEFSDIADSIVEPFPSESKQTWFDEVRKGNTTVVEGRLRFKYYSVRGSLYKASLITKKSIEKDLQIETAPNLKDLDLAQLNEVSSLTASSSWHRIIECWEATREVRFKFLSSVQIDEYISKFPCLQHNLGWTLIAQDGIASHPCLEFISNFWDEYSEFVLSIIRKSNPKFLKVDGTVLTEEEEVKKANFRFLSIILKLPNALFKVRTLPKSPRASKSDKKSMRPSKKEIQDAFCLHLTDIALLEEKLTQRRDKLSRYKYSLQPIPVVIGSPDDIKQCFIIIDNHRWEVESPSAALWGVMQLCFGLNASYPVEARHIFLFLQQTMLKLSLPRDYNGDKGLRAYLAARVKDYERFMKENN